MVSVEGDRKPEEMGTTLQFTSRPAGLIRCASSVIRIKCLFSGGGGPHVGEVTRIGGVTRPSIYSPILI